MSNRSGQKRPPAPRGFNSWLDYLQCGLTAEHTLTAEFTGYAFAELVELRAERDKYRRALKKAFDTYLHTDYPETITLEMVVGVLRRALGIDDELGANEFGG